RQACRYVYVVAQRGEIRECVGRSHRPDKGGARMNANADWQPGFARAAMPGFVQQFLRRLNSQARMIFAGQTRNVQPYHLIANQLIDHRIGSDEYLVGDSVKSIQELAELRGTHLLSQRGRAAHISKQHRQFDLGPTGVLECKLLTVITYVWILVRSLE